MPIPDFVVALREHVGHSHLGLVAATAVVLRGESVLLVRRSDNGRWTPTAGIVEPEEEPHAAAVREVLEETGVTCEVERLVWVYSRERVTHVNGDVASYLELVYRCAWVSGEPYPADDESTEAGFFAPDALPPLDEDQRARIRAALSVDGSPWLGADAARA